MRTVTYAIFQVLLPVFAAVNLAPAQERQPDNSFWNKKTLSLIGVSSVSAVTLIDSYYMWWKDDRRPFTFLTPAPGQGWLNEPHSLGIDKIGHFYTSLFLYHTKKNILTWGGYDRETASWISLGLTSGLALLIEIGDGFTRYGFDYQDLVFNIGGAGYGMLQDRYTILESFIVKWSYVPTDAFTFPPHFTDHYDGHIYWLAFDINNLADIEGNIFPSFLLPAIGFSVADKGTRREYIIGLDIRLDGIFPKGDANWGLLRTTLGMIHLPAPGMKSANGKHPEYRLFLLN